MPSTLLKSAVFSAVILLGACSSMPTTTPLLDQARGDFVAANNNPQVSTYAPLEFKQAGDALELANAAAARKDNPEAVDKLAYLAKQKIATAQEVAKQKAAEADVAAARGQRDALRLQARTVEADRARMDADAAQAQATAARNAAAGAQQEAMNADARTRDAQARSAQLEAQMAELQAKQTERGMIITIGDVLFDTDQARLKPDGVATLRKLAEVMAQNPNRTLLVEGFTDSTGSSQHNQDLSERRAGAVRSALTDMGVARERIAVRGYGEHFPVVANNSAANRQLNRRVEIVISKKG